MLRSISITIFVLTVFTGILLADEECTIGVATGKATSDGRPLIWKTRDNSGAPNNEVYYNTSYDYDFIAVVNANKTYAWMGVNEHGFAILNSLAKDLPSDNSGYSNGSLMRHALGYCASIQDFDAFLDATNSDGRQTRGNFAVLDSSGRALMYEIAGADYWVFDADDSAAAPQGYIIRTNFAENGTDDGSGRERYDRSHDLIASFYDGDSLDARSILRGQMRDFSDFESNPVAVPFADRWLENRPYGYIYTGVSICRSSSVSAAVIQGTLQGESNKLTTMWTILGQPATSVAVPYWPVGDAPSYADGDETAPLCDVANQIRGQLFDYAENEHYIDSYKLRDDAGDGLWTATFTLEDSILNGAHNYLREWRQNGADAAEMLVVQEQYAGYAYHALDSIYNDMLTPIVRQEFNDPMPRKPKLLPNYPNPFNAATQIHFELPRPAQAELRIYNALGQCVDVFAKGHYGGGQHSVRWQADHLSSGLYFLKIKIVEGGSQRGRMINDSQKLILLK